MLRIYCLLQMQEGIEWNPSEQQSTNTHANQASGGELQDSILSASKVRLSYGSKDHRLQ